MRPASLLLALILWLGLSLGAVAREQYPGQYDHIAPDVREWVRGLKDKRGIGCCDTADGYPAEYDWDIAKGKYRVRIDGQWYDVPDDALLTEPNKLGYATVWWIPTFQPDGTMKPLIRCFLPGAGG